MATPILQRQPMNLEEIRAKLTKVYQRGTILLSSGKAKPFTGPVSLEEGMELASSIEILKPEVTIETGVAFGLSTLAICLALEANGKGMHYGADPCQHTEHEGAALALLEEFGVRHRFQLLEGPAHRVLASFPHRAQFALIDGWHTFDYKLIDFFLIDQVLDPKGVVGFHDSSWNGCQRVLRFALSQRHYRLLGYPALPQFQARNYNKLRRLERWRELYRCWWYLDRPLRRRARTSLLFLAKLESWEPNFDFYTPF